MQQLFVTLQEERKLHQERIDEVSSRVTKMQQDSDRSHAAIASLTHQLLQQS
jgi:hypothetical protein